MNEFNQLVQKVFDNQDSANDRMLLLNQVIRNFNGGN